MSELKEKLEAGKVALSSNEEQDEMELSFGKSWGGSENFKVEFNGKFTKLSQNFRAVEKEADRLIAKFDLELDEVV